VATHLCRSGAEALEVLARDQAFDAVLTDHNMPEMDGLALAQRIRARGLSMPIVLLTSNPSAAREGAGAEHLGAVIQKPILRADLYRQLQALTGKPLAEPEPLVVVPKALRQMRVLTAEDNRTNQLVFQKMVKDLDIELVFANNGREAVDLYRSFRPDLIFMDISMPEMDGREAARAIRGLEDGHSHVPIVALTAHAMDGDADGILAAGIDRYMTKPLRKAAITGVVAEFCPRDVRVLDVEPAQMTGT
jgi:CheY-like chemotaxis protein